MTVDVVCVAQASFLPVILLLISVTLCSASVVMVRFRLWRLKSPPCRWATGYTELCLHLQIMLSRIVPCLWQARLAGRVVFLVCCHSHQSGGMKALSEFCDIVASFSQRNAECWLWTATAARTRRVFVPFPAHTTVAGFAPPIVLRSLSRRHCGCGAEEPPKISKIRWSSCASVWPSQSVTLTPLWLFLQPDVRIPASVVAPPSETGSYHPSRLLVTLHRPPPLHKCDSGDLPEGLDLHHVIDNSHVGNAHTHAAPHADDLIFVAQISNGLDAADMLETIRDHPGLPFTLSPRLLSPQSRRLSVATVGDMT